MGTMGLATLDYRPPPPWYHRQAGEEDVYLIESTGLKPELLGSAICRIEGEFPGNSTRRNEARARARAGLVVGREDASLGEVLDLVAETLRVRHEAKPVHTRGEIEALAEQFPGGIRCYVARIGPTIVAGIILFVTGFDGEIPVCRIHGWARNEQRVCAPVRAGRIPWALV